MNILAIDSSQQVLSLALFADGKNYVLDIDAHSKHDELLLDSADKLCRLAGIRADKIEIAACMKGPGSFTGLRIAYAAAKGLALALDIPLRAYPTLDCIALGLSNYPALVIPAIDAKQGRFFCALYRSNKILGDYLDLGAESISELIIKERLTCEENIILTGSGAELLLTKLLDSRNSSLDPQRLFVDFLPGRGRARELLEMAKNDILIKETDINSGPMYIRKSDAEIKR